MAVLTADEVARMANEESRKLNARQLPPTLLLIQQLMKDSEIFACNVGPWPYLISRPCVPQVLIPPYDPKDDPKKLGYAKSGPFPGIHRFSKIGGTEAGEMAWCEDDGRSVLLDIIGVGFGHAPQQALSRFGVFVPAGKEPTREEIAGANAALSRYLDEMIREARELYDAGGESRKAIYHADSRYLQAARMRGINEAWVTSSASQESVQCENCGKFNPSGVAMCSCGTILDFDLHFKIQSEQRRRLAEFEERMTSPTMPSAKR